MLGPNVIFFLYFQDYLYNFSYIQYWKNSYPHITIEKEDGGGYLSTVYVEHPNYYDKMIDEWKEDGVDKFRVRNDGSYDQPSEYELRYSDEDKKYSTMCELVDSILTSQQ